MATQEDLLTPGPRTRSDGSDEEWVHRFGPTERFAHWWTVLMVSTALVTGLALGDDHRSGPLLVAHWGSVALIGIGLLGALAVGDTRGLLQATWRLFSFDRHDLVWVRDHLRHPGRRGEHGDYGMFNTGQKALAWALSATVAVVVLTGLQSLSSGGDDASGPHAAAVVVAMALIGAHVFMAALNPSTNHALRGMTLGRVRRSWAAQHHGGWLKDMRR